MTKEAKERAGRAEDKAQVERVARAIWGHYKVSLPGLTDYDDGDEWQREIARGYARVAANALEGASAPPNPVDEAGMLEILAAMEPFAKLADITPMMEGRGENTRPRIPADSERFDWYTEVTWGMLRAAKAAAVRLHSLQQRRG